MGVMGDPDICCRQKINRAKAHKESTRFFLEAKSGGFEYIFKVHATYVLRMAAGTAANAGSPIFFPSLRLPLV